jgi:16S rRNA (uracil1498-N3)-methyltransferase
MSGPVTLFFGTRRLDRFEFAAEDAHHLCRVLRHIAGDRVWALDGNGSAYEVALETVAPRHVEGRIVGTYPNLNEAAAETILLQGLIGQSKMDWLVEKATELGVTEIRPLLGGPRIGPGRLKRWQRIARSASKQCRRARVPLLSDPVELEHHLRALPAESVRLLADPEGKRELPDLPIDGAIVVAVGPEKGFDRATRRGLLDASFQPVSLGPRRLRAETAAVCMLSLLAQKRDRLTREEPWTGTTEAQPESDTP